jgi:putative phage-type endonuclease
MKDEGLGTLIAGTSEIAAQLSADTQDRRTFIGGSDAPIILGLAVYKNRFELYQEKIGEKEPDDLSEVERVQWGIILEAVVAEMYTKRTGKKVRRVNDRRIDKASSFPRAAQIDRRIVGGGILEIKTTDGMMAKQWGPEGSAEIPPAYYAQVQHQMAVTGDTFAEVAVLIGGNTMKLYQIPRDESFIADLTAAEEAFWRCVETRTIPTPITVDEADTAFHKAQAGVYKGTVCELQDVEAMKDLDTRIAALEEERDRVELRIKNTMGAGHDVLMYNGTTLATWKNQSRNGLDTKKLEEDHPEIVEKYRKLSEFRVFRLK